MRIGVLALSIKPVPPVNTVCAPNLLIFQLVKKLQDNGHEVILFAGEDSSPELSAVCSGGLKSTINEFPEVDTRSANFTQRKVEFDLILSREAIRAYKDHKIDIIHSHDVRSNIFLFSESNIPVLYTIHNEYGKSISRYDRYKYNIMKESPFGMTNISKENAKTCHELGIADYGYTPNGVDSDKFAFNGNNREGMLLVGRMVQGKKIKEAIEISEKINTKITLIGPAGMEDADAIYFEDLQKNYFTRPNVEYKGFVNNNELLPFYQKAKVLIYTSSTEGLPLGILEAQSTGLPVVASAVGGIPDVIQNGYNGFLIEANDTEEEILNKVKEASVLQPENCRKAIEENYTLQKMTENYICAYERFITDQKG